MPEFSPQLSGSEQTAWQCSAGTRSARGVRTLVACGYFLIAWGLVHLLVWCFSGEAWEGAVSWRKPTLFGVSGGLTLLSMGCLLQMLEPWRHDRWLAYLLASAMSVEVGLISLQQWRGVPSHFNHATQFNSLLDTAITLLITLVTLAITVLACRAFFRMNAGADRKLAWRGGLAFLLGSCVIGFVIWMYGEARSAAGLDPTTYGLAGVAKFPHGVAIHAIQLLPALCWLLRRLETPLASRLNAIALANLSIGCMLGFSVLQTLAGRARADIDMVSGLILIVALGCSVPVAWAIALGLHASMKPSPWPVSREEV